MLKKIIEIETKVVFKLLKAMLIKEFGLNVIDDDDNYIFYQSNLNPICLVAHIDTVRKGGRVELEQTNNIIRNKKGVLGADDRAGVYGILELLYRCKAEGVPYPSVLFTNYEESGGVGVGCFIDDCQHLNPFKTTTLFIELDRGNSNQYVYYSWMLPEEIKDYVESFGFVGACGTYSDVADLTDFFCIPAVNLSVGFYKQHTKKERLHIDELNLTINRVFKMLKNPVEQLYPMENDYIFDELQEEYINEGLYIEGWDYFGDEDFESEHQNNRSAKQISKYSI